MVGQRAACAGVAVTVAPSHKYTFHYPCWLSLVVYAYSWFLQPKKNLAMLQKTQFVPLCPGFIHLFSNEGEIALGATSFEWSFTQAPNTNSSTDEEFLVFDEADYEVDPHKHHCYLCCHQRKVEVEELGASTTNTPMLCTSSLDHLHKFTRLYFTKSECFQL